MKVWWLEASEIPLGTTTKDIIAHTQSYADYFDPTISRVRCSSYESSQQVLRHCNYKPLNGSIVVFTRSENDLLSCRKTEIVNVKEH
ncbi:hypothetical protein LPJ73_006088, partial [Coemansia sp. RSA 2703]